MLTVLAVAAVVVLLYFVFGRGQSTEVPRPGNVQFTGDDVVHHINGTAPADPNGNITVTQAE